MRGETIEEFSKKGQPEQGMRDHEINAEMHLKPPLKDAFLRCRQSRRRSAAP